MQPGIDIYFRTLPFLLSKNSCDFEQKSKFYSLNSSHLVVDEDRIDSSSIRGRDNTNAPTVAPTNPTLNAKKPTIN